MKNQHFVALAAVAMGWTSVAHAAGFNEGYIDNNGTFTLLNMPYARGINNAGDIVGGGTLYSGGNYSTIYPLGFATGINDLGQYSGVQSSNGFISNGTSFITLNVPGANVTDTGGINNAGNVVGLSFDSSGKGTGFLYSGGVYSSINVPGVPATGFTQASGINNLGQIVGSYDDAAFNTHGFLYSGGIFYTLDVPGAVTTYAQGINDSGQIVGSFVGASGLPEGYLYSNGIYTVLGAPAAPPGFSVELDYATGINNSGQIVGETYFVAPAVPEASTWAMLLIGFVGIGFVGYRSKNKLALNAA